MTLLTGHLITEFILTLVLTWISLAFLFWFIPILEPTYFLMWGEVDLFVWLRYMTPSILVLFARASQTKLFYPLLAWELFMMLGVWENIHNGLEVMS